VRSSGLFIRLFAVALCASTAGPALRAQRGGPSADAAAPPTLVPVTASSLAAHPASYVGRTVTMMGTVAQQLSPTIFTVDQGPARPAPGPVLVIAPSLVAPPSPKAYVSVIGDAVMFDPSDLTRLKSYSLDIAREVAATYRGRPAVFATSVVTADLTDLAKKKPAPLTPEEQAYSNLMKQVNTAAMALRTGVTASNAAATQERAAELKTLFTEVRAFWKKRGIADAEGWAGDALELAETVDVATAGSKWPEATAAATRLNQVCTTCHNAYRERLDDGTFRFKGSR
jgi:hypothetical protein